MLYFSHNNLQNKKNSGIFQPACGKAIGQLQTAQSPATAHKQQQAGVAQLVEQRICNP